MDKKIKELKERFRYAGAKEIAAIDKEMDEIAAIDPETFSQAMLQAVKSTAKEASQLALREKLKDVLPALSVTYFAKNYFKKKPQWFYQRLNENTVNGKRAYFTEKELSTLSEALLDISQKINKTASRIS